MMREEQFSGFEEEERDHVCDSIEHLMMWKQIIVTTRKFEWCDEIGWAYGNYPGGDPFEVYDEQAVLLMKILDPDALSGSLLSMNYFTLTDGHVPHLLAGSQEPSEEDMLFFVGGDHAVVESYKDSLLRQKLSIEKEGLRVSWSLTRLLSQNEIDEDISELVPTAQEWLGDTHNFVVLVDGGVYDTSALYDAFRAVLKAWQEVRDNEREDEGDGASKD